MQRAGVGVVDHIGAMSGNDHKPGEAAGERHRPQNRLSHFGSCGGIEIRVQARGRVVRRRPLLQAQRGTHKLDDIDRPGCLDKGEGRHRRQLVPTPSARCARPHPFSSIRRIFEAARTAAQAWVEQHWQPAFLDIRREAAMRGCQPEKSGEPERASLRVDRFKCPAKHLRSHIDAECGLQCGAGGGCLLSRRQKRLGQRALRSAIGGFLKDCVQDLIGVWRNRQGMRGHRRLPGIRNLGLVAFEQRGFPDQADCQKVGHGVVGCSREFCLPQPVTCILRPTPQRHQQTVKIGLQRRCRQCEPLRHAYYRARCALRRFRNARCKSCKPDDLGRQVVSRDPAPRGVSASAAGRRPQRLALVEIPRCPGSETLGDQAWPIDARGLRREIGNRRHCAGFGRGLSGRMLQRCQAQRAHHSGRGGEGVPKIGIADGAAGDPFVIPASRHCHRRARHTRQPRANHCEALMRLAQEGIDRDTRGQRPKRRNCPGRTFGRRFKHQRIAPV